MLRPLLPSLVAALAASLILPHAAPEPAADAAPWLEMSILAPAEGHDGKELRELAGALVDELEGQSTEVITDVGGTAVVRATIWDSIEAVEDAALALDGSEAAKAIAAATGPGRSLQRHYRQIRSAAFREGECGHLELVRFRTRAGTTRDAHLERFDLADADFEAAPGVLGHSLWIAPDGEWLHLVEWTSAEEFDRFSKQLMRTKGAGAWVRSLDFQRFTVLRGR